MCDLDRLKVKGPGLDATYHVHSAEVPVFCCHSNVNVCPAFYSTAMCFPTFLLSMAVSNLLFVPAVRQ